MKKIRFSLICVLLLLLNLTLTAVQEKAEESEKPRPLEEISDIMAWKSIRSSAISKDGKWFAYYLAPQEGDGVLIIRETQGDKEYKFSIGEPGSSFGGQPIAFSEDSSWLAYTIYPTRKEAKQLKEQKKKTYNNVGLVDLRTGEKTEIEKIKTFAFSEENPGWIAFHKYPAETQEKESKENKWKGSDLILHELMSGDELSIGNVAEFAFDKKGKWLAWIIDAYGKTGNGVQIRDMATAVIHPLDSDKAEYSRLTWTEKGDGLAVLKGKEDKNYEDKLYSVVGFTGLNLKNPAKVTYDPNNDDSFPDEMTISPNRNPIWTDDLSGILFGIHEVKKKEDKKEEKDKERKDEGKEDKEGTAEKDKEKQEKPSTKPEPELDKEDLPDVVIWHGKDPRLQAMQQVQENRDKNFSYLCVYRVKEDKFLRLADDKVKDVTAAPKHLWAIGYDDSEYELMGNLDGRRYRDVYVINMKTGERRLALKKARWTFNASPDGTHFLYYEDGHYYTYEMASGKTYNITQNVPTSFINTEDDHNVVDPPIHPYYFGWAKNGVSVLLYDNWDVWNIPVHGGKGINLTQKGKEEGIRFQGRFQLDPDEKGIDLSQPLYLNVYGERTKKGGIGRIDKGKPGVKMLLWDDAVYSLRKAEDIEVYLYTKQTYKDYPDYYVCGADLADGKKITEANPQQKDFLWSSGSMLLDYESAKGDKLQAALFLPANYEKGKKYPLIVYFYEKLSQNMNRYFIPSARGFNKSVYNSRGYAVLMPDIVYTVNDPGMSAVWCVLPAVEAAISSGVVDKDNIGIHGHSWGGYQSSFLITQTDMFSACVTGAPLTNMISMYSSIYWNSGSANQPIFESSQGRFTGGYWENLEAYARNSPVYHAENVTTPVIILHNDKDGAVDWNQGIEYYNTLRRLGKDVIMLQYKGENHGLRKPANQKDYTVRMREFFDHHLMGKPAPEWMKKGVSHLDHEEHIKDRTKAIIK